MIMNFSFSEKNCNHPFGKKNLVSPVLGQNGSRNYIGSNWLEIHPTLAA
jgi:hypothetical protein